MLAICSNGQAAASAGEKIANILSLEGGGARAITHLTFLSEVEMEAKCQTGVHIPISKIFDIIGGSSAGAIVAAGLTLPDSTSGDKAVWRPRFTAKNLLSEFETQLPNLFQSQCSLWGLLGPKYKSSGPQQVAENIFGNTTFDQALTRTMITTFDLESNQTVLFKSWKPNRSCFYIADVVRGSGAAPTYFDPHKMSSINGTPLVTRGFKR